MGTLFDSSQWLLAFHLRNIFHVNEWDGRSDTEIALKPIKTFTPQRSLEIVKNQDKDCITKDLEVNEKFYKAFNEWLDDNRR